MIRGLGRDMTRTVWKDSFEGHQRYLWFQKQESCTISGCKAHRASSKCKTRCSASQLGLKRPLVVMYNADSPVKLADHITCSVINNRLTHYFLASLEQRLALWLWRQTRETGKQGRKVVCTKDTLCGPGVQLGMVKQ